MKSAMMTQLHNQFSRNFYQKTFCLRALRYPEDMPLIYQWMHAEHVVAQWQLHLPMPALKAHIEKALADDHQRLYIVVCDGVDIGYTEVYEAKRDRLARYYQAKDSDIGWHLLLGNTDAVGRGYLKPTGMLISEFIFEHTEATKIVVEPDSSIELYQWVTKQFGYFLQRYIEMPEKKASLYFCHREDFYQSNGYQSFYPTITDTL